MSYEIITPASGQILTTDEAKAQAVVEHAADNTLVDGYILAAQTLIEALLSRQLLTATLRLNLDRVPLDPDCPSDRLAAGNTIWLRRPPVQSVTHVKYLDSNGTLQTWAADQYEVDLTSVPPRIVRAANASWPSYRPGPKAIQVTFVAGYGLAAAVPQTIKQAAALLVDNFYENRSAVVFGTIASDLPMGVEALLSAERWGGWCDP